MPNAAAIIIGDEILSGKFADENGPYFIRRLRDLGTDLERLTILSDDLDAIADEVRRSSAGFDHVFTTGGVGPTHDDMTLEGIGRAFGVPLVLDDSLVSLMSGFGMEINPTTERMARIPEGAVLVETETSSYPVLRFRNVWVFPGVPKLMQVKFESVCHRFAGRPVHTGRLYVTDHESAIAATLADAASRFPDVEIGSYPRFGAKNYRVIVTFESRDEAQVASAIAFLSKRLPLLPG